MNQDVDVYEGGEHTPAVQSELTVEQLIGRQEKIKQAMAEAMSDGVHYGRIPGVPKPTLFKAGAETLCSLFMFDPEYETSTHMDDDQHFHAMTKATLFHIPTGNRVASGEGYCTTAERRYAFVKGSPVPVTKRPEQYNTIVKMAGKRALVAAVLNATAASDVFTQDVEDTKAQTAPDGPELASKAQIALSQIWLDALQDGGTIKPKDGDPFRVTPQPVPEPFETWKDYSKNWILEQFHTGSRTQLTSEQIGKLIDHLARMSVPFG